MDIGAYIHLTPSDDEERVVNMASVREAYRLKFTVGWTYEDGSVSSCTFKTKEEAEDTFAKITDLLTEDTSGEPTYSGPSYLPYKAYTWQEDTNFASASQSTED